MKESESKKEVSWVPLIVLGVVVVLGLIGAFILNGVDFSDQDNRIQSQPKQEVKQAETKSTASTSSTSVNTTSDQYAIKVMADMVNLMPFIVGISAALVVFGRFMR